MFKKKLLAFTALAVATAVAAPAYAAGGLITIIVNDPSNPYWLTEGREHVAVHLPRGHRMGGGSYYRRRRGDGGLGDAIVAGMDDAPGIMAQTPQAL